MGENSAIAWTTNTFNPWHGCLEVSPACDNCYARIFDARIKPNGNTHWGKSAPRRFFGDKHWNEPLKWDRKAAKAGTRTRTFSGSMCDIMESPPNESLVVPMYQARQRLFQLTRDTPNTDWLFLTKRTLNYGHYLPAEWFLRPPENVWLMTTVESQEYVWRIQKLIEIPAYIRGLSMEPLLGPVNLSKYLDKIDWVIAGGESTPKARETEVDWYRSLRDQCAEAGVAFFMKQMTTKGELINIEDWPADLRIRQFPKKSVYNQKEAAI